jgi:tight adherence protein C
MHTLFLLLGAAAIFVSIALALSIVGVASAERRGVGRSLAMIRAMDAAPDVIRKELDRPFSERVVAPLGQRLVGVGRMLTRADTAERLRRRLDVAGNPPGWDVERIIGLKALGLAVFGGLALVYCLFTGRSLPLTAVIVAGLSAFGFLLPNILLNNAGEKREEQIRRALPDALDLLSISVEAGLAFDAAVSRVARSTKGPLAQELARVLQEMQIGVGRTEAFRALGERTTLPELRGFVTAMVQADSFGVPIGRVLRVQSKEMRVKRRQRAEEKAQKLPVKILFPLVLFVLPCLLIVVIGPAVLSLAEMFDGTLGSSR